MFTPILIACALSTLLILALAVVMVVKDRQTSTEIGRAGQEFLARRRG